MHPVCKVLSHRNHLLDSVGGGCICSKSRGKDPKTEQTMLSLCVHFISPRKHITGSAHQQKYVSSLRKLNNSPGVTVTCLVISTVSSSGTTLDSTRCRFGHRRLITAGDGGGDSKEPSSLCLNRRCYNVV